MPRPIDNRGMSVLEVFTPNGKPSGVFQFTGGNSGCVISPAPGLGLSAYQDPKVSVKGISKVKE